MLLSKTFKAIIICLLFNFASIANNIIIVESQSYHPLHIMDQEWLNIATVSGDDAAIYPQSILDDATALSAADVLIVSSAVILLDDNKINNILTFVQDGGNVYLQSEFLSTLSGNVAYQQIATDLGVTFNWENEFPGYVTPIELTNTDTPIQFDYWFYAGSGSGDENVEVIAQYLEDGVGFSIQSPIAGQGKIVTLSDQDWIRQQINIDGLDFIYEFINTFPIISNVAPFIAPEITIQATNNANCPGDIVNFSATITDTPTPYTLQWFLNGVLLPSVTSISFSTAPASGDVITCQVTYQNAAGETTVLTSNEIIIPTFNIPNEPVLTMTVNTTELCGNETAFFNTTINNSTDLTNLSYTWRVDGLVWTISAATGASIGNFQDGTIITCDLTYDTPCESGNVVTSNGIVMNVTTPLSPTIQITGNQTICSGETVELTANGNNWGTNPTLEWFVDGTATGQTGSTFSPNNLVDGQTVTCEVLSSIDCYTSNTAISNNLVADVTNMVNPTISIIASATVCTGEAITYTASGTGWDNLVVTEWYIDGIATGTTTNTFTSNNFNEGQIITCELSNFTGCVSSSSIVSNELTVNFSAPIVPMVDVIASATACDGEPITFTATGINWDPNAVMEWYVDGTSTGNNTTELSVTNLNEGQIVNFELSNLSSCYSESSIISNGLVVAYLPSITPTLSISVSPTVCPGESITFTATGDNWDPNGTINWLVDGVATASNTDELTSIDLIEGQVVNAVITTTSDCYTVASLQSNEIMVEYLPAVVPTIAISASAEACPGEMITFTAIGNSWDSNTELEWFVDGVATGNTTAEFSATTLVAGQEITCELSNLPACANTTSITSNNIAVSFAPTIFPTINITTTNTTICENEMATIAASGDNWGTNFQLNWYVDGQLVVSGNSDLELNIDDENQIISAEIISDLNCADTAPVASNAISFEFIQPTQPLVTIGVESFNCSNNNYTIKADGVNLGTNPTFEWFIDDLNVAGSGDAITSILQPGQTVYVIVQTANECTEVSANSSELEIEMITLEATIEEQGDAICMGGNGFAKLAATGGEAPYTYMWSDNDTNEFRTALDAGTYQVTITDLNGCEDIIEVAIGTQAAPMIQDIEITDVDCGETFGSAVIFIESDNDVVINWKNEDDQVLSTEQAVNNLPVGNYQVEISDANGCFDIREFEVQLMTAPSIAIDDKIEIKVGESTDLQPLFSHGQTGMTYEWFPAIGLSCTDCENPTATPLSTTTYTLNITTDNGCTSSTTLTIYVDKTSSVYVPNIFSPNGDGLNDNLFVFGGQEVAQINSMMVFNRGGETIFSRTNIQPNDETEGWNGTFKGKQVQSGVYVYFTEVVFIDGRVEIFKGDVFVTK